MTNLDSILKNRDITLPTKVRLVKAMVFPVVMYGCESWTVKQPSAAAAAAKSLQSCPTLCDPMNRRPPGLPPLPTPGVHPNPCPLSQWCQPTISSSVIPFSSCPQSFPVSGSFQMSQLFASGGHNIGVSASTSVLPMNTQDWFPIGWTGWIFLQSKGFSRVFSSTTVQKHQFFSTQLSLYQLSHP